MFRITQEAIWNIERHSKATEIAITITFTDGEVRLGIKDNGIGFKVPPVLSSFYAMNKLGMIGMQERAELLGGKLEVQSNPKKGVTVSVTIPDYHSTI
jgi:signal transduction histidine kinase